MKQKALLIYRPPSMKFTFLLDLKNVLKYFLLILVHYLFIQNIQFSSKTLDIHQKYYVLIKTLSKHNAFNLKHNVFSLGRKKNNFIRHRDS